MTEDGVALSILLTRIAEELAGIRKALELATVTPSAPAAPAPDGCDGVTHPDDCRLDFGGMGDFEEWECAVAKGGCGYHHTADALLKVD